jgi:hypothetical protein
MFIIFLIGVTIWEVYWTYHACWLASRLGDKKWFLFFLTFALLGIPEIIYIKNNRHRSIASLEDKSD